MTAESSSSIDHFDTFLKSLQHISQTYTDLLSVAWEGRSVWLGLSDHPHKEDAAFFAERWRPCMQALNTLMHRYPGISSECNTFGFQVHIAYNLVLALYIEAKRGSMAGG